MSLDELMEIIDKGLERLDMTIDEDAKRRTAVLSEGLPFYTHLLSLHGERREGADERDQGQAVRHPRLRPPPERVHREHSWGRPAEGR